MNPLMKLKEAVGALQAESKCQGEFRLHPEQDIREAVRDVPDEPGVYLIYKSDDLNRPIYIGKAGTYIGKAGTMKRWKTQGIKGRLTAVQKGMSRNKFFIKIMREAYPGGLTFHWFVTHDRSTGDIPAFVEMRLLQMHYEQYGSLPELNESV